MDRHYINDPKKTEEQLTSARDAWLNKYVKRYKPEPFKYKDPIKTTEVPKNIPGTTLGNILGQTTTNAATPGYTPVNILGNNRPLSNTNNNRYGNVNTMSSSGPGYANVMSSAGPGYSSVIPPTTIPPTTYSYAAKPFLPNNIRTSTIDPQQPFQLPTTITNDDGVTIESVPYQIQIQNDNDEMLSNMISSKNAIYNAENDIKKLDKIYEQYMDGVKIHEKSILNQDFSPDLKNFQEKYGTTDTQGAIRQAEEEFRKIVESVATYNDVVKDVSPGNEIKPDIVDVNTIEPLSNTFETLASKFVSVSQGILDLIILPGLGFSAELLFKTPGLAFLLARDLYRLTTSTNNFSKKKAKFEEDEVIDSLRKKLEKFESNAKITGNNPKTSIEYEILKGLFNGVYGVGSGAAYAGSYVGSTALSATQTTFMKMIEYGNRLYNSIGTQIKDVKLDEDTQPAAERIKSDISKLEKVTAFLEATKIVTEATLQQNNKNIIEKVELQEQYPSKSSGEIDFNSRLTREELANKEQNVAQINQNFEQLKSNLKATKIQLDKFTPNNEEQQGQFSLGDKFEALVVAAYVSFVNDRDFINSNPVGINAQNDGFTLTKQDQNLDNIKFEAILPGQKDSIYLEKLEAFTKMINFLNQLNGAISSAIEYGGEGVVEQINLVLNAASQFVALFNPGVFSQYNGATGDSGAPNTVFTNKYKESGTRGMGIKKYNEEIATLKTGYGIKGIPLIKDKMQEMIGGLVKDLEPKYKTYEPVHKIIDHLSTLPKFKRGGLVRKETYGCGICKHKPGYGKRFLVHNKNNKDITCSKCFGDHGMTGGRITERDAEFNFIEDSKDPEHEEMVSNQKTNDYLDEIEKERPNTAFEDFDASANIDKRFVKRMGSDFVVNRPYDMRKNFEAKDLDRLAYLVGMHEHAPEQMTTPLKVNMEALAINHLTKNNDPQATFANPSKLQNFDSVKQELQSNPGFLKRFLQ